MIISCNITNHITIAISAQITVIVKFFNIDFKMAQVEWNTVNQTWLFTPQVRWFWSVHRSSLKSRLCGRGQPL